MPNDWVELYTELKTRQWQAAGRSGRGRLHVVLPEDGGTRPRPLVLLVVLAHLHADAALGPGESLPVLVLHPPRSMHRSLHTVVRWLCDWSPVVTTRRTGGGRVITSPPPWNTSSDGLRRCTASRTP